MPERLPATLFVDIGNTSIGVGRFDLPQTPPESSSPSLLTGWWKEPTAEWHWRPDQSPPWNEMEAEKGDPTTWVVASVNRDISRQLQQAIRQRYPRDSWETLESQQFPVETQVADKAAVGADRLAAVTAANALRSPGRPVVIVDAGSAINVELVDANGVFLGGAILPGMAMAARALAVNTDLLPTVQPADAPPTPVGRDTNEAIRSGLYWGSMGAIRELSRRMSEQCSQPPHVMITGGGVLWRDLSQEVEVYPHLVLSGIALAWLRNLDG